MNDRVIKIANQIFLADRNEIITVQRFDPLHQDILNALLSDDTEVIMNWMRDHWEWHSRDQGREVDENVAKKIIDFARKTDYTTPRGTKTKILTKNEWTKFKQGYASKKVGLQSESLVREVVAGKDFEDYAIELHDLIVGDNKTPEMGVDEATIFMRKKYNFSRSDENKIEKAFKQHYSITPWELAADGE